MKIKQNLVRFGLPLVGLLLAIAAWQVISQGKPKKDMTPPAVTPAQAPRNESVVAGAGVVEPSSELIAVANAVPGVIDAVLVQPGQVVQKGQPLFTLDDTESRAEASVRRAALTSASQRAKVAEIEVMRSESSLELYNRIQDKRAIILEELNQRDFAAQMARAKLSEARSAIAEAQAALSESQVRLNQKVVRAPISGSVLQVKARPGQYAPSATVNDAQVTLGSTEPLHVRVDIDEADLPRLGAIGVATVTARGSQALATTATLVRIEPLIVPKRSLTNGVNERVDTRVLQAIFALPKNAKGFAVGQQIDAFITVGGVR